MGIYDTASLWEQAQARWEAALRCEQAAGRLMTANVAGSSRWQLHRPFGLVRSEAEGSQEVNAANFWSTGNEEKCQPSDEVDGAPEINGTSLAEMTSTASGISLKLGM